MQILTVFKLSFMAISSLSSYLQGLKFLVFFLSLPAVPVLSFK